MRPTLQIAHLLGILRCVSGRKKFQKMVHILQELGHPFPQRFEYSYYGMYSQQLRNELDALCDDDLIREAKGSTGFGDPTYSFEATSKLETILKEVGLEEKTKWSKLAQRLNDLDAQSLEAISTILFLRRRGLTGDELKNRVLSLKPHLKTIYPDAHKQLQHLEKET